MKTKTEEGRTYTTETGRWKRWTGDVVRQMTKFSYGDKVISYGEGPEWSNDHRNWKPCTHTRVNSPSGFSGSWAASWRPSWAPWTDSFVSWKPSFGNTLNLRAPDLRRNYVPCMNQVLEQLDLNCHDAVLSYSGVLQAIPLVGGALKCASVLNRLGRRLSKSIRRKPFSTVVKSAIQADFIDRFVVGPMIADAQKFMDASNYVVRQMNLASQRSRETRRYTGRYVETIDEVTGRDRSYSPISSSDFSPNTPYVDAEWVQTTQCVSELFLLLDVKYNHSGVDPIKFWAARTGYTRPLESLWDLVPFSFVVDYIFRAGDFITGLSNEMSDQDGLRGQIAQCYGCWGTCKAETTRRWKNMKLVGGNPSGYSTDYNIFSPGECSRTSSIFVREVVNPWGLLSPDDTSIIRYGLNSTRYRTLLELFLQAKL